MKSRIVAGVTVLAIGISGLTGCTSNGNSMPYYDTICVDRFTHIRLPDVYCRSHPADLYYVRSGYSAPAYGRRVSHYSRSAYTRPHSAVVHTGGVPSSGGKAKTFKIGNYTVTKNGKTAAYVQPKTSGNKPGQGQHTTAKKFDPKKNFHPAPKRPAPVGGKHH